MGHRLILSSSTILVTLLILSPPTATAASPVLDTDGNPLEAGSQYYVLTSGRGAAGRGGLTAEPDLYDGICPWYVGQYFSWTKQGSPVSFHPADPSQTQLTLGEDVNIAFGPSYVCRNQGVWQLETNGKRSENCQQFDATLPGPPGRDWSWLKLVPIDDPLPFFGFVFKKFTSTSTSTTILNPKFTTSSI
ncbi:21 kDa seed protein-like [Chenopodium quinoa]|uniref:21 kDa seed protein-like n=1 Tax=Chenopodium quinoa TaxID=63459 RepID=UPI000B778E33|nr:21 kDa seed protein-like [Chenopodium quinoa]